MMPMIINKVSDEPLYELFRDAPRNVDFEGRTQSSVFRHATPVIYIGKEVWELEQEENGAIPGEGNPQSFSIYYLTFLIYQLATFSSFSGANGRVVAGSAGVLACWLPSRRPGVTRRRGRLRSQHQPVTSQKLLKAITVHMTNEKCQMIYGK